VSAKKIGERARTRKSLQVFSAVSAVSALNVVFMLRVSPAHDNFVADRYTPESVSSGSLPVLPPIFSTGTPILSISVTSRLAIVGLSE
jgi:hypothetical protein